VKILKLCLVNTILFELNSWKNQLMTLIPNYFPCIEYCLSKFKTLRILCIECQLDLKEDQCIYVILSKIGSSYYVFVSTFMPVENLQGVLIKNPLSSPFVIL
jgi:hypothetical protein